MKTFKTFLIESSPAGLSNLDDQKKDDKKYTPKAVSIDKFIEWCENNAIKYLKGKGSDGIIYRGTTKRLPPLGIIDTNDFSRVSSNTFNYYTIWIDNHHQWKSYPKRSKSLICTTSEDAAIGYGDISVIIPSDNSHVGICPMDDIWYSIDTRSLQLNEIVEEIYDLIMNSEGIDRAVKCQIDYDSLVESLKKITKENIKKISNSAEIFINDFYTLMKIHDLENMYEVMEYIMDPRRCGFKEIKAGVYSMHRSTNKELWIQGECAVVYIEDLEELSIQYKAYNKLKSFFNKYGIPFEYE